jgi:hypothetical protein
VLKERIRTLFLETSREFNTIILVPVDTPDIKGEYDILVNVNKNTIQKC